MKKNFSISRANKWCKALGLLCVSFCSVLPVIADDEVKPFVVEIKQGINPSMNEFVFKLDCYEDDMEMCYTKTITISDAKTGEKIQTLTVRDFNDGDDAQTIARDALELIVEDVNFDGFADIRINAFVTAGANRLFICWLWDTEKKQFIHNKVLSEIVNLDVDHEDKHLYSLTRVHGSLYVEQYFRYENGALTLFKTEEGDFEGNSEQSQSQRINMLDDMSDSDWRALNIFFSNFYETGFEDFIITDYDNKALIAFALQHNVKNTDHFESNESEEYSYLSQKYVVATLKKYFDIDKISVPNGRVTDFISHKNGKYYWEDVFEGAPWFAGNQVIELYDNHDGTFSAIVENYNDNNEFQMNFSDNLSTSFYAPKKTWKASLAKHFDLSGYHIAKIAAHTYNGKETYKLLEWYAVDTLEDAKDLVNQ